MPQTIFMIMPKLRHHLLSSGTSCRISGGPKTGAHSVWMPTREGTRSTRGHERKHYALDKALPLFPDTLALIKPIGFPYMAEVIEQFVDLCNLCIVTHLLSVTHRSPWTSAYSTKTLVILVDFITQLQVMGQHNTLSGWIGGLRRRRRFGACHFYVLPCLDFKSITFG